MMSAFLDGAFRSLVLAGIFGAGLRAFRVRNVLVQKRAWAVVLVCALLTPAVLPFAARWRVFPAATLALPSALSRASSSLRHIFDATTPQTSAVDKQTRRAQSPPLALAPSPTALSRRFADSQQLVTAPTPSPFPQRIPMGNQISLAMLATWLYFAVAAALLLRLLHGLAFALRLWRAARPVRLATDALIDARFPVRFSRKVSSPVTVGSGVILPADFAWWGREKLRIVLAHERAHIRELDFYLQILASFYAALVWFSPLGWWLKRKLSDLGETISDRSGLLEAADQTAYAQILLEFAAAPRPTLIGVAMARQSSISRRIERLLNDRAFLQAFAGGRRARLAVMLIPIAFFAVTALIRVQAASESSWKTGLVYLQAGATADPQPTAAAAQAPAAAPAAQGAKVIPATGVALEYPGAPGSPANPPSAGTPASAQNAASPAPASDAQTPVSASQATFDRTLSFSGNLLLSVSTTAGNIALTTGPAGQVHIHGTVRSNRPGNEQEVQDIVANPPIEQNGNAVHIGEHRDNMHKITISYEIEAPADTTLAAETGSGNIADQGVGQNTKLETGSGNITATGLQGGFKTETGSGDIAIQTTGKGDAWAETASGKIDLNGVHGSLKAETGSGTIKAAGTPSSNWKLEAGSGTIELATGDAPLTLDASTGSGRITTDRPLTMQTSADKHHVQGQINGGGPNVRVETGSGDIHIQ
jgi:beta-lactamase regulating signal transducer with metallopeptidase domain